MTQTLPRSALDARKPGKGLSALVLDDDAPVGETLCAMLRMAGATAHHVACADSFFDRLRRDRPDIVVIDLVMPGRDGLDIVAELAGTAQPQVIIASGRGRRVLETAQLSARAQGLDVLGTLPKPVRRGALLDMLALAAAADARAWASAAPPAPRPDVTPEMLRQAIATGEIGCQLQPKVRLSDGQPYGFEALARWTHPVHGPIRPDEFIPVVSAAELDHALTRLVLDAAITGLKGLGDTSLSVAVNVPMKVCADPSFGPELGATLDRHGLMPRHVILEVTEAGPNAMTQAQIDALMRLRLTGHTLSIDDFGTGVSSLERLVRIPFDELKIDRAFTRDIVASRNARGLIRSLTQMAKLMDMVVTIEGVEDARAIQVARKLGCDNAQGYGVARPMAHDAAGDWLRSWRAAQIA